MKTVHLTNRDPIQSDARTGTTLMEVLMSVMIMSIGVISLASLFPVSIIRGVKATNLTSGTILRYNAEALIDAFPDAMVHDPDGDGNRIEHRRSNQNYIVDPLGYYFAQTDNNAAGSTFKNHFGNDGAGNRNTETLRYNGGLTQAQADQYFLQQDSWTLLYDGIPGLNAARDTITIDVDDINDNIINMREIASILGPDVAPPGWDPNGGAALPGNTSLLNGGRLVLFDSTDKQAQVRALINTDQIDLAAGTFNFLDPLPSNSLYSALSRVRIEVPDQRYSFLLTVRHQPIGLASVDVVVFFRRNYSPEHETLHDVENFISEWISSDGTHTKAGFDGIDDDDDGTIDEEDEFGWPGSDDIRRRTFRLHFNLPTASSEKPNMKKGGFLFDHQNARWYRIQKIENNTIGSTYADITLDQPIIESITRNSPRNGYNEGLIVMPNVVQVYPLGNKVDPNAN